LLEEMRAKGVEPNVFTHAAVIDAVVDQLTFARRLAAVFFRRASEDVRKLVEV
jgi:hypothetical protein